MGEPAFNLDPNDEPEQKQRPNLQGIEGGGESTPPATGHLRAVDDVYDDEEAGDDFHSSNLARREAEGYAPDTSLPRRGGALPQRGGTLPQRKEKEALANKTGLYRDEGAGNTADSVGGLYDNGAGKSRRPGLRGLLFGAGGSIRERASGLSGGKKALLFGAGLSGSMLAIVIPILIILFATLKIPNLSEHITSWQFARTSRSFRQSLSQINAEKIAVDTASDQDYGVIKQKYLDIRSSTWGKLDKWRPGLTYKNLQATGTIDYRYSEPNLLGRQKLEAIRMNGADIYPDNPSFLKRVGNRVNPLTPKSDIILAAQIDANLEKSLQGHNSLIRGRIAKKIHADIGIELHWWDKQGSAYKNALAEEADLIELRENLKRIQTDPGDTSIAAPIKDATEEAKAAQQRCLENDDCAKQFLKADPPDTTGIISDAERARLNGDYPTNYLSDEARAALLGNVDDVKVTAATYASTVVAVAMPLCIIYDGSVERSEGSVDAASDSAQKSFYAIASASAQQRAGSEHTTAEAIGATNRALGDISGSVPEKRARNQGVPVSTDEAIVSPEASAGGMFSLFGALFGDDFASKVDPIAEPTCGALTDWRVGLGVGAAELALAIATGGGTKAGGATVQAGTKATVSRVVGIISEQLLSKKAIGRMIGETAAIAGVTVLAKMIVLSRMNAQNSGVARGQDKATIADAGGNLAAREIDRKMMYGRPMTQPEVAASNEANRQYLAQKKSEQGVFQRYFATSNPDSLLVNMGVSLSTKLTEKKSLSNILAQTAPRMNSSIFGGGLFASMNPFKKQVAFAQEANSGDTNYNIVQSGWTEDELAKIENDPSYFPLDNDAEVVLSGMADKIKEEYGECFEKTMGTLLSEKKIQRDEQGRVYPDAGKCAPNKLSYNNPDYGDMVFRWRLMNRNNNTLDHLTDIQAPTNSESPTAGPAEQGGGLGISEDGFVFPLQTTKSAMTSRPPERRWCYQAPTNCHHDYNAADIMADTGTPVVAARGGRVIFGHNNPTGGTGSSIAIMGDDKNVYWYGHLKSGSVLFSGGETVTAGQKLGEVGTDADAQNTPSHLHIDVQPPPATTREGCTNQACNQPPFKFLDIQPALVKAFEALPT